jgi:hypothetical protein
MGKRGPKPIEIGLLTLWEFEFYKAFHFLREGTSIPARASHLPTGLTLSELRRFIQQLKRMSPKKYWLTNRRLYARAGQKVNLNKPPTRFDLEMSEWHRASEIRDLEQVLTPPKFEAQANRRKIWDELVKAATYSSLRKVCGRWAQIPDVRRAGLTPFPKHVLENAGQFISMKTNKRFPRSRYGENARLDYLARGMAGAIVGVSGMTGIERLRNMKHDSSGPLWNRAEAHCSCWRCSIKRWTNTEAALGETVLDGFYNGLKLFMELAPTTKIPEHWK